jgi:hypothetical protein
VTGRRLALIVAIDRYDNEGLRHLISPAADAEALAGVLGDPAIGDFEVTAVRNQPAHIVSHRIEDLFSDARPDDVLLLHFSCHGLKSDSGDLFFAATDTRPDRLGSTAVSADFVQRCMRASRSRSIVLLLDCCYGGAFGQGVAVRATGEANVLDTFRGGGRGRAVITASSAMEYAFEGDRLAEDQSPAPSVFTAALVEGLSTGEADRDEDGWVSLDELYDYVFDKVRERNTRQTPSRDVEMQGDLYLARSDRRRVKPAPVPADLRAAMHSESMFARMGAVAELRARLSSADEGVALGAAEALREIAGADIKYVADAATAALEDRPAPAAVAPAPVPVVSGPSPVPEAGRAGIVPLLLLAVAAITVILGFLLFREAAAGRGGGLAIVHLGITAAGWCVLATTPKSPRWYRIAVLVPATATAVSMIWMIGRDWYYMAGYAVVGTPMAYLWLLVGLVALAAATAAPSAPAATVDQLAGALVVAFGVYVLALAGRTGDDNVFAYVYSAFVVVTGLGWAAMALARRVAGR